MAEQVVIGQVMDQLTSIELKVNISCVIIYFLTLSFKDLRKS